MTRRLLNALLWSFLAFQAVAAVTVLVLISQIGIILARDGIYEGSRQKCLAHMTQVYEIEGCNRLPYE